MDAWTIYWITRLDSIQFVMFVICGVFFSVSLFTAIFCTIDYDVYRDSEYQSGKEKFNRAKIGLFKILPITASVCLIFMLAIPFIPTTKEAVAIYALPKIANNEQIQKIGTNGMEYINEQLKAWIDDVKGEEK